MATTTSTRSTMDRRDVLVGVDGSQSALTAVRWAAHEAASRGQRLHIIHADPHYPHNAGTPGLGWRRAIRRAHNIVARARQLAHSLEPAISIDTSVVSGAPAPTLVQMSGNTKLIILGARGIDGFAGLELGAVATTVSTYAQCPVVIVRTHLDTADTAVRPVVVGVDESATSRAAIDFAFDYADRHHRPLVAVHAWREVSGHALHDILTNKATFEDIATSEQRLLAEAMSGWTSLHPDVPVTQTVVRDRATDALLEQAPRAELVVVGSRGRSAFAGAILGSTSQQLVRYASAPVAIIHTPKTEKPTPTSTEKAAQSA